MWHLADRLKKTVSDVTVGTVIVLVHVMLGHREASRASTRRLAMPEMMMPPRGPRAPVRRSFL
jgi:hypothetical protein